MSTRDQDYSEAAIIARIATLTELRCQALTAERDRLSKENARLLEALSVIAGNPRQDDTYVRMTPVQIARAALSPAEER